MAKWPLSDIFAGITFTAILLAIYLGFVRFFADSGIASVHAAVASFALSVAVSVYFGAKMNNPLICLYAVANFWMFAIWYDVIELELKGWEISRFATKAGVFVASHLSLQLLVWTITHRRGSRTHPCEAVVSTSLARKE